LKSDSAVKVFKEIASNPLEPVQIRRSAIFALANVQRSKEFAFFRHLILHDNAPEIRIAVADAFAIVPHKRAFYLLSDVISQDQSAEVRWNAIRALNSFYRADKKAIFDLFISRFNDPHETILVRAYAIEGLGYLGDSRALDLVINNLNHEAIAIRFMAAFALGLLGDSSHIPLLKTLLDDQDVLENWGTVSDEANESIQEILNRSTCAI
jgi:hypothetical protein